MKLTRYFLAIGFAAFCMAIFVFGWNVSASKTNLEQRFAIVKPGSDLSKAEQTGEYDFDTAHSSINFRVRHMGLIEVPGNFRSFVGKIDFNADKIKESTVTFTADVKSVDTGVNARDNHLRSKDFFEVMTYPEMKFTSGKIKKKGKRYIVRGNLTIKDVTREVDIPVRIYGPIKDERGTIRMGVAGSTTINRRVFNVSYGGNLPDGTAVLSDAIGVDLQIEAVKKKKEAKEN